MNDFKDFLENEKRNNIIVQRTLRDIDSEVLVTALVGESEEIKTIFLRNMSERAKAFLLGDIAARRETPPEAVAAAQSFIKTLLEKHARNLGDEGSAEKTVSGPPSIDLGSNAAIITTFCALAEYTKANGLLSLEGLQGGIENPLMRKGLLMHIDGWDPLLVRSILENYKASYLRNLGVTLDLIIEGLDSLAAKDNSLVTEQKLRSLVAEF
jgi:hypothetical protein